jgi:hypothetical protein
MKVVFIIFSRARELFDKFSKLPAGFSKHCRVEVQISRLNLRSNRISLSDGDTGGILYRILRQSASTLTKVC